MAPSVLQCLSFVAAVLPVVSAATADQWRGKNIYQVLTDRFWRTDDSTTAPCNVNDNKYCGGTYKGIIKNLDYIQNMGMDAIWISPITNNTPTGYHGYYQNNLYALNPHFGTEDDLKALSKALHDRGMYLMVDVVTNHFGSPDGYPNIPYSQYYPFNSQSYFHPYISDLCPNGDINYDYQPAAEACWLYNNLPDLRTEDQNVVDAFSTWISQFVSKYGIDGLRIDSVKNVNKASMTPFCKAAGVYCLGELANGNPDYSYPYQAVLNGGGIINYPIYDTWTSTWLNGGSMANLAYAMYQDRNDSIDANLHGTFTENHDNPRVAFTTNDIAIAKNSIAWTMLTDGIPIIYYGQEQHFSGADDPGCREAMWLGGTASGKLNTNAELYKTTTLLAKIRHWAVAHSSSYTKTNGVALNYSNNQISIKKDVIVSILTSAGTGQSAGTYTTQGAAFGSGTQVVDVVSCKTYTANGSGEVTADVGGGVHVVMLKASFLSGSGLCGR
ncbi:glycoside hydrolase family 13 protein [Polychaeton citri CBS 116435]|uniref:alpha-amylase n=1 Tax=Polychaeton citri CBS 116435 TaxID=1314669 RepID=A0A9P4QAB1_9PEZI|nr:glycoside hydrolase family 13 protein [Polychaeton citri CBS 116435]